MALELFGGSGSVTPASIGAATATALTAETSRATAAETAAQTRASAAPVTVTYNTGTGWPARPSAPVVLWISSATNAPAPPAATSTDLVFIPSAAAPVFTADTPPPATVGTAYSYAFAASSATSFALATGALPAGLTLSPSGALTGTPTTAGTSTFTITATGTGGTTPTGTLSIVTGAAPTALGFTNTVSGWGASTGAASVASSTAQEHNSNPSLLVTGSSTAGTAIEIGTTGTLAVTAGTAYTTPAPTAVYTTQPNRQAQIILVWESSGTLCSATSVPLTQNAWTTIPQADVGGTAPSGTTAVGAIVLIQSIYGTALNASETFYVSFA
jgi:hypothetical protein